TDSTNEILSQFSEDQRIRVILNSELRGKAAGLNDAVQAARGEIVVFADARQKIESDAVRMLVENFSDPAIGCASGELMLGDTASAEAPHGIGLYWTIEKRIRHLESASGSVIGATGALYAVRRSLLVAVPPETILEDVYLPLTVERQGAGGIVDGTGRAWDRRQLRSNGE